MPKVLFVIAHPNIEQSFANRTIIENYKKLNIETEYDDLYKLYPDYKFDVKKEQEKLVNSDIIVLQFPYYWYDVPFLLKKWFEDVLLYGFAYGSKGTALRGKRLLVSFTTGAPVEAYKGDSEMFTLKELTTIYNQIAVFCGMKYEGFIVTGGLTVVLDSEGKKAITEKLEKHAKEIAEKVKN
jgi:putative NADPH-quinone reductase